MTGPNALGSSLRDRRPATRVVRPPAVMFDAVPAGDGGVVAAGYATPPGSYSPGGRPRQGLLVRLDAFGGEVWRACLGEPANDACEVRRVRRTADGGYIVACVAGTVFGFGSGGIYCSTSADHPFYCDAPRGMPILLRGIVDIDKGI